jgi:hypothetical protein
VLPITRPAFLFGGAAPGINPAHALIALMGAAFSGSAYATIRPMPAEVGRFEWRALRFRTTGSCRAACDLETRLWLQHCAAGPVDAFCG